MKIRKPKVWEWILVGVLILVYLFREELHSISGYLPPFLAFVLEFYSEEPGLWFGLLIGLCILLGVGQGSAFLRRRGIGEHLQLASAGALVQQTDVV